MCVLILCNKPERQILRMYQYVIQITHNLLQESRDTKTVTTARMHMMGHKTTR